MKDGGINVSDPTGNAPTKKARMVLDTNISRLLSNTGGLVNYAYRDAIHTLSRDQLLMQPVIAAMLQGDDAVTMAVNNLVTKINRKGFGTSSLEWATALFEWMDYIDYGGTEPVPLQFSPFVEAYYNTMSLHGLTFDRELSNRYVTRAGDMGVLPMTPVISKTNRVYRDRNGNIVSLRPTTSNNPSLRAPEFVGAAGFASAASKILGKGSKSVWKPFEEDVEWEHARFGMLHIDRKNIPGTVPVVTISGFDKGIARDLAQSALNSYEIQSSPLATKAVSAAAFYKDLIVGKILQSTTVEDVSAIYRDYEEFWSDELTEFGNSIIDSRGLAPNTAGEGTQ